MLGALPLPSGSGPPASRRLAIIPPRKSLGEWHSRAMTRALDEIAAQTPRIAATGGCGGFDRAQIQELPEPDRRAGCRTETRAKSAAGVPRRAATSSDRRRGRARPWASSACRKRRERRGSRCVPRGDTPAIRALAKSTRAPGADPVLLVGRNVGGKNDPNGVFNSNPPPSRDGSGLARVAWQDSHRRHKNTMRPAAASPGADTAARRLRVDGARRGQDPAAARGPDGDERRSHRRPRRRGSAEPRADRSTRRLESVSSSLARYFSWQPPQFLRTPGIVRLEARLIDDRCRRRLRRRPPSFTKRALKSALLSQIAGRALVSPVLLSVGKQGRHLRGGIGVCLRAPLTAARSNGAPFSIADDRLGRLAIGLHQMHVAV